MVFIEFIPLRRIGLYGREDRLFESVSFSRTNLVYGKAPTALVKSFWSGRQFTLVYGANRAAGKVPNASDLLSQRAMVPRSISTVEQHFSSARGTVRCRTPRTACGKLGRSAAGHDATAASQISAGAAE